MESESDPIVLCEDEALEVVPLDLAPLFNATRRSVSAEELANRREDLESEADSQRT